METITTADYRQALCEKSGTFLVTHPDEPNVLCVTAESGQVSVLAAVPVPLGHASSLSASAKLFGTSGAQDTFGQPEWTLRQISDAVLPSKHSA